MRNKRLAKTTAVITLSISLLIGCGNQDMMMDILYGTNSVITPYGQMTIDAIYFME